jgi:hypothetical protein
MFIKRELLKLSPSRLVQPLARHNYAGPTGRTAHHRRNSSAHNTFFIERVQTPLLEAARAANTAYAAAHRFGLHMALIQAIPLLRWLRCNECFAIDVLLLTSVTLYRFTCRLGLVRTG